MFLMKAVNPIRIVWGLSAFALYSKRLQTTNTLNFLTFPNFFVVDAPTKFCLKKLYTPSHSEFISEEMFEKYFENEDFDFEILR